MTEAFPVDEVAQFENETWSRCARSYSGGFAILTGEAVEPLLKELDIGQGDRVLDMGTGPGLVAAATAKRGAAVIGIDFSEAMITEAQQRHPDIKFLQASAEALPFENGAFDKVVGNFILHHSGHPRSLLEEAYRVLEPGGKMGFTVWGESAKLAAFGLFFAAVEQHAGAAELPHGPLFGVSDFAVFHELVRNAGFRDISVRDLDLTWEMRSIDTLLVAFNDWAKLDAFPHEVRTAIETTVRKTATAYESTTGFSIPNPAILITAVK